MTSKILNLSSPILMTFTFNGIEREEGIYQLTAYPRETGGRDERNEEACRSLVDRIYDNCLDVIAGRDDDDCVKPFKVEMLFAYDVTDALRVGCISAATRARAYCDAKAAELPDQDTRLHSQKVA